jgi:hypothetical protein
MSSKRDDFRCPKCGARYRKKALRCPSCGESNPLQESPSFGERIGLSGTLLLLAVVGVVLLLLTVWLMYELLALGSLNPYLLAAGGLLILVGIARAVVRRWRK